MEAFMAKPESFEQSVPRADNDLLTAFRERAKEYHEQLPVYQIIQPSRNESVTHAQRLLVDIWAQFRGCRPLLATVGAQLTDGVQMTKAQLPDEGHLRVFHASGAIAASKRSAVAKAPIGTDEREIDRKPLMELTKKVAHAIAQQYIGDNESLRSRAFGS
jgi:hypothetical protein